MTCHCNGNHLKTYLFLPSSIMLNSSVVHVMIILQYVALLDMVLNRQYLFVCSFLQ